MPRYGYVLVGLFGMGAAFLLRRFVDWMGARRGLMGAGPGRGAAPRSQLYSVGLAVGLGGVLVGLFVWGSEPVVTVRRSVLVLLLFCGADADARWGVIPNELIVCGLAAGALFLVAVPNRWPFVGAAVGAAGILFAVREASAWGLGQPGFGFGDVKLVAVLGLFLGWEVLWGLYLAALIAGLVGGLGMLMGRLQRTSRLPLAPFLVLGTVVQWFVLPFEVVARWLYV